MDINIYFEAAIPVAHIDVRCIPVTSILGGLLQIFSSYVDEIILNFKDFTM